jgi:hypothetical protein
VWLHAVVAAVVGAVAESVAKAEGACDLNSHHGQLGQWQAKRLWQWQWLV